MARHFCFLLRPQAALSTFASFLFGCWGPGQEINEKTYTIAKADMLMKGEDPENIKRENTLSHDLLPGKQFNYMLSNPPFGKDWKNIREEIEAEHARGAAGRYGPGLPDVGDGAMLFLLHKLSKFTPHGSKLAIIFNGSPLFNGDAGSGPSNIRKYLLENDWLDAIVAMPNDLFYNTSIPAGLKKTYRSLLAVRDETAAIVKDGDSQPMPDSELRDFENVPLKEDIDAYFAREVLPHVPDAWMDRSKDKVGYEISFTKYFYEYTPLRSAAAITAELLKLDEETENLLREVVQG